MHIVHPSEPTRLQTLRVNHDVAIADGVARRLGHRVDLDPPLQAQPRLDRFAAAPGVPDAVQVGALLGDDPAVLGQRLAHRVARLEAVQSVELGSGVGDPALVSMIDRIGRLWRNPISKSFGPWAGVTLTALVPNSGSTWESATTTISRS